MKLRIKCYDPALSGPIGEQVFVALYDPNQYQIGRARMLLDGFIEVDVKRAIAKTLPENLLGRGYSLGGAPVGKLSRRQKLFSALCKLLAGDHNEERATNLLPKEQRIAGLRLRAYNAVRRLRWNEGNRLFAKYGTHTFC